MSGVRVTEEAAGLPGRATDPQPAAGLVRLRWTKPLPGSAISQWMRVIRCGVPALRGWRWCRAAGPGSEPADRLPEDPLLAGGGASRLRGRSSRWGSLAKHVHVLEVDVETTVGPVFILSWTWGAGLGNWTLGVTSKGIQSWKTLIGPPPGARPPVTEPKGILKGLPVQSVRCRVGPPGPDGRLNAYRRGITHA